jgi:hypothetical protein
MLHKFINFIRLPILIIFSVYCMYSIYNMVSTYYANPSQFNLNSIDNIQLIITIIGCGYFVATFTMASLISNKGIIGGFKEVSNSATPFMIVVIFFIFLYRVSIFTQNIFMGIKNPSISTPIAILLLTLSAIVISIILLTFRNTHQDLTSGQIDPGEIYDDENTAEIIENN